MLLEHQKDEKRKEEGMISVLSVFGNGDDENNYLDCGYYHVVSGVTDVSYNLVEDGKYIVFYNGNYRVRRIDDPFLAHGTNASLWTKVEKIDADEVKSIIFGNV